MARWMRQVAKREREREKDSVSPVRIYRRERHGRHARWREGVAGVLGGLEQDGEREAIGKVPVHERDRE